MAPEHRRRRCRNDRPQGSSTPPPPPMPPGQGRRNDRPQSSSTPPPPPMPPGQGRRNDRRQRSPFPPPPPDMPGRAREDSQPEATLLLGSYIRNLLDIYVAEGKLEESQRRNLLADIANPELTVEELKLLIAYVLSLSMPQLALRKELLDTTTLEKSPITNASSSSLPQSPLREDMETNELLDSTTLDKSSITKASSSQLQSSSCEDTDQPVNHDTIKVSSPSSQNTPPVFSLKPTRLNFQYYVRVDRGQSFHTYPALTGPFRSLEDAQDAINSHHAEQCKIMCMKGLSQMERGIRRALYWPNGLRRNSAEALAFMKNLRPEVELVRALLDKYNEDNFLSEDPVYELIEVVGCEPIRERNGSSDSSYYHFNLVIRTKGADDSLYFAEVACINGEFEESVLTFFHMLKPEDNGECLGCCVDMKHPSDVEYKRGRPRIPMPGGMLPDEAARAYTEEFVAVYDEAALRAQEARVRNEFKELYERRSAKVQKKYVVPAKRQAV